jgi:hypothetical protein
MQICLMCDDAHSNRLEVWLKDRGLPFERSPVNDAVVWAIPNSETRFPDSHFFFITVDDEPMRNEVMTAWATLKPTVVPEE